MLSNSRAATIQSVTMISIEQSSLLHFQETITIGQISYHTNTTEYDIFIAKKELNAWT